MSNACKLHKHYQYHVQFHVQDSTSSNCPNQWLNFLAFQNVLKFLLPAIIYVLISIKITSSHEGLINKG